MHDDPRTYPLLRGRRRRRAVRRRIPARWWRIAALAALGLALVAGVVVAARRAAAPDPRAALPQALAAFARGNYSAMRNHAQFATTGPDAALAQGVLARAYLELGEGVAAEGALTRAAAAGLDPARLPQLQADAALVQGDPIRALALLARATPRYAPYARRVRARALAARGDVPGATAALEEAIALTPRDAAAWTDLGRIRFDAGDVAGADRASASALALDPRRPAALVLRGEVIRSRYGLAAARPWFAKALASDAYYHPALIADAATAGDLGDYGAMLASTRRALAARPGSPPALYLQAVMAARAGRFDLARAILGRIGDSGGMPGVALLAGAIDYAGGKYEQAVAAWREVVGRQPMNLVGRRLLGAALIRSGDAKGALDVLRPIALRADADSYTLTLVGRAFEATGERDWAARFLDRAARPILAPADAFGSDAGVAVLANQVADAPGDPGAAVAYIRGLVEAGDTSGALARARGIAAVSPGVPDAQVLVGDVLAASGQPGAAFAAYTRAADLRFDAPVLLRMVEAAGSAGRRPAAAEALALYLSQNPRSIVAHRALANLQLGVRDWRAAIDTLEALRDLVGPRDALVAAQLAYAYTGAGDPQTALGHARAAYALLPMNPAVCDAYGWALYEAGETAAALQLLDKAAAIAPRHAGIAWHRAQALAEAGRTGEARAAIAQALADPAFLDRRAATALMAAIGG